MGLKVAFSPGVGQVRELEPAGLDLFGETETDVEWVLGGGDRVLQSLGSLADAADGSALRSFIAILTDGDWRVDAKAW